MPNNHKSPNSTKKVKHKLRQKMLLKRREHIQKIGSDGINCAANAAVKNFFQNVNFPVSNLTPQYIAIFHPLKEEFNTIPLLHAIESHGYICLLPIIKKEQKEIEFAEWHKGDILEKGSFNLLQPKISANRHKPNLIITPLLAFDNKGNRLGYGGGYYDRFLAKNKIKTIGIAFSIQEVKNIPTEKTDKKINAIITEKEFRYFK